MKRLQEHDPPSPPPATKRQKSSPPAQNDQEGGEWTRVEKRKNKKLKKLDANTPRFMYSKGEILKRRDAVAVHDIRDLVLHLVADAPPPSWVRVENARSIQRVVTLLIPGITPDILSLPPFPTSATANPNLPLQIPLSSANSLGLPFIANTFSHTCPTRAPGDQTRMHSVLSEFFQSPVSGEEKKRRIMERVASERQKEKTPLQYVLTTAQMIENDYPMPSYMASTFERPNGGEGWVEVPDPGVPVTAESEREKGVRVLAIDCEMCQTEDDKQLARVCLVDYESGIVVYDQLIKPDKPVTDYLTRWSGITPATLATATTTFHTAQTHLLSLLSPSPTHTTPILLGHSLESDLKALRISHPRCIDTAVIYHHPRGRPLKPGLAWLTKKWCGREIQNRGEGGHDPEEDARACVELLRKKVEHGPGYGEFKLDFESIFERMSRSTRQGAGGVRSAVVDHGNPANWHGSTATTTVGCKTDEEVVKGVVDVVGSHGFVFGRLTGVADELGWITNKSDTTTTLPSSSTQETLAIALEKLNAHLTTLYAALPPRTGLVIFTGHSDPRKMAELNARKNAFEGALRGGGSVRQGEDAPRWTAADGRALEEEVDKAKRGLMFLGVKDVGA